MFDIGWSELVIIAIVALVVIGPKELPATLRTIGKMTARARKVAGDFRAQFDEAMREAELDDVRQTISDAQKLNPVNSLREAMNPLRQMGNDIKADLQRSTTTDKPATATSVTDEPVPGVAAGLPEALSTIPASNDPAPVVAPLRNRLPLQAKQPPSRPPCANHARRRMMSLPRPCRPLSLRKSRNVRHARSQQPLLWRKRPPPLPGSVLQPARQRRRRRTRHDG